MNLILMDVRVKLLIQPPQILHVITIAIPLSPALFLFRPHIEKFVVSEIWVKLYCDQTLLTKPVP